MGTQQNKWWLSVLVQRLRERGPFERRQAQGVECFYGNPLRNLARVGSPPEFKDTDLVRERKGLQASDLTLWQVLSTPYSDASVNAMKTLAVASGGWPYRWACLSEWLAKNALVHPDLQMRHWSATRLHFCPDRNTAKYFRKNVLMAYVELFERLARQMDLPAGLFQLAQPSNGSTPTTTKWEDAPAFAGMLLTLYLQAKEGHDERDVVARGRQLNRDYWTAIQSGDRVTTPGGLKDFPNYGKYCAIDRLEYAMAVDNYLHEYMRQAQRYLEDDQSAPLLGNPMPDLLEMPTPEDAANLLGLPWLNQVGQRMRRQATHDGFSRFAAADLTVPAASGGVGRPLASVAIDVAKTTINSDADGEPVIEVFLRAPTEYQGDLHDLRVVVYTEAIVDGCAVSDAAFAFVDAIEVIESMGQDRLKLAVLPIYASKSVLYQLSACRNLPVASARFVQVPWNVPSQLVLGIHVVLGKLSPPSA